MNGRSRIRTSWSASAFGKSIRHRPRAGHIFRRSRPDPATACFTRDGGMMDFGNLLTKVLPWIGAAATGNVPALITMAAKEVGDVLGVDVPADAGAIGTAVANA